MFSTVIIALLLVAALVIIIRNPKFDFEGDLISLRWAGVAFLAIALIWSAFTCLTIVQAKQVGVLTTFGKPSDRTLGAGLHVKAPWQKNTQLDGTIQSDEYRGDDCIYVRLGDGNTACVSTTNRWRISLDEADTIYSDYRSDDPTESLRDAVVSTQFKASVNSVLGKYNPTAALDDLDATDPAAMAREIKFAPDYDSLSQQVEDQMNARLSAKGDPLVFIDSITISYIQFSDKTQQKIDDYQAEVANTRIALQKQATATAQARANEILSDSISNDPNVLVSKCFDTLADMAEGGEPIPAGFSCWPGGGSAVVIPQAGAAR